MTRMASTRALLFAVLFATVALAVQTPPASEVIKEQLKSWTKEETISLVAALNDQTVAGPLSPPPPPPPPQQQQTLAQQHKGDIVPTVSSITAAWTQHGALLTSIVDRVADICSGVDLGANVDFILANLGILVNNDLAPAWKKYEKELRAPVDLKKDLLTTAKCAATNAYLMQGLVRASTDGQVAQVFAPDKVAPHKDKLCKSVLMSTVLGRTGKLIMLDIELLSHLNGVSNALRNHPDYSTRGMPNIPGQIKHVSVEWPTTAMVNAYRNRDPSELPKMKDALAVNILEAVALDFARGRPKNARSGYICAAHSDRSQETTNPITGAEPTKLTAYDNPVTVLQLSPNFPVRWADLYQVWNMAFTVQFNDWPLYWAKLVNPCTACYQANPRTYVFRRAITLLQLLIFAVNVRLADTVVSNDWYIFPAGAFDAHMQSASLKGAKAYDELVTKFDPRVPVQVAQWTREVSSAAQTAANNAGAQISQAAQNAGTQITQAAQSVKSMVLSRLFGFKGLRHGHPEAHTRREWLHRLRARRNAWRSFHDV